ncbi:MAG: S1 RNA-binding domain-containing protein [Lachnospiraceae bacterium]|nr:S1 RNA-binding domain-containing protein [Lachnospiraceae bacterium]
MEENKTMADYAAELEASFRKINVGDILEGTVIGISETEITLDLGYYTDGIVRLEDISDNPAFSIKADIEPGQTVSATVIKRDDGAGHILLSMKEAAAVLAWDKLKELLESQENITVKVTEITKGGAVGYLEGIRGFIPASKLSLEYVDEADLENYLYKSLEVRVINVEEENKRLVMSAREILKEAADAERAKKISNVEVGLVTEGVVETLKPYGAFVNLGNGLSGLLHISQICQNRIKHPGVVLKEGQTVKVKITEIKDGKLSLSMKALEDVAAKEIEEEVFEIPEAEEVTTSLGSLLSKFKL